VRPHTIQTVCTILLAWRAHAGAPIVLAANRDELIGRPSQSPGVLHERPMILGGRDLVAGGTWLAVGVDGTLCAVTNRHPADGPPVAPDPSRRSRGEIPVELLTTDAASVPGALAALGPGVYNPVNVLWVSPERALVAHVDDTGPVRIVELTPGPHVLTTHDVDDAHQPKVAMLMAGSTQAIGAGDDPAATMKGMRVMLASHISASGSPVDAACIHGDVYGTVSASTVIAGNGRLSYEHAPGRPCVTPFTQVAIPS
jgi:uncharacterized protein with NRDE domain